MNQSRRMSISIVLFAVILIPALIGSCTHFTEKRSVASQTTPEPNH